MAYPQVPDQPLPLELRQCLELLLDRPLGRLPCAPTPAGSPHPAHPHPGCADCHAPPASAPPGSAPDSTTHPRPAPRPPWSQWSTLPDTGAVPREESRSSRAGHRSRSCRYDSHPPQPPPAPPPPPPRGLSADPTHAAPPAASRHTPCGAATTSVPAGVKVPPSFSAFVIPVSTGPSGAADS